MITSTFPQRPRVARVPADHDTETSQLESTWPIRTSSFGFSLSSPLSEGAVGLPACQLFSTIHRLTHLELPTTMVSPASSLCILELPEETLAEIFAFLPRSVLPPVNLTAKSFHRIARPLLFRDLQIHPYVCIAGYSVLDCPPSGLAIPSEIHITYLLERLQYWASPDIAPLVRTCSVSPWSNAGIGPMVSRDDSRLWDFHMYSNVPDPYILLNTFFDALPSFTSLRTLTLKKVHFRQTALKQLELLPSGTTLCVDGGHVILGEEIDETELNPLPISQFEDIHHRGARDVCLRQWIPRLDPDILIHLDLTYNPIFIEQILVLTNTFPRVTTLAIELLLHHQWSAVLAKFPATETLSIRRFGECEELTAPHVSLDKLLPLLKKFTGPSELLEYFLVIPALRRLSLDSWVPPTPDEIPIYLSRHGMQNIVSMRTKLLRTHEEQFSYFVAFSTLCSMFSNLTELHIDIADETDSDSDKLDEFLLELELRQAPLPGSLRKLAVDWLNPFRIQMPALGTDVLDRMKNIQDTLVSDNPQLGCLWMNGSWIVYLWRRGSDLVQHCVDVRPIKNSYGFEPEDTKIRREECSQLWNDF
ncbi:hypothetical protein R3P38DRAFT_3090748 [Favolaschia claudopus]|uniref:F-box domain-containing protein n=1 Tax=Favolaschia claudopus TaxID=2862362 RepID=A0AAV9ZTB1_9AGAR